MKIFTILLFQVILVLSKKGRKSSSTEAFVEKDPRIEGEVVEIGYKKNMRTYLLDEQMNLREPFFLFFMNEDCLECKKGATELGKLARMLKDQPKVGRVDCTHDFEACDLFVNHNTQSNKTYPFMIMATKERSYIYSGKIDAEHIIKTFISNEQYREFPIHGGKGYTTKRIINDGRAYIEKEMQRREDELAAL